MGDNTKYILIVGGGALLYLWTKRETPITNAVVVPPTNPDYLTTCPSVSHDTSIGAVGWEYDHELSVCRQSLKGGSATQGRYLNANDGIAGWNTVLTLPDLTLVAPEDPGNPLWVEPVANINGCTIPQTPPNSTLELVDPSTCQWKIRTLTQEQIPTVPGATGSGPGPDDPLTYFMSHFGNPS